MSTVYQGSGPSYRVWPHPDLPELSKVMLVEAATAASFTLASWVLPVLAGVAVSHVAPDFSGLS